VDSELFDDIISFERYFSEEEVDSLETSLGLVKTADEVSDRKKQEHALLEAYQKNPSQATFMPLYTSMKPLISSAAFRNMKGSTIPQAVHTAYAAQNFLDSIKTYSPNKGAFRVHAFNSVFEKGKRLNLKYQNIGYIPEHRSTKYQVYQTALHLLREDLGREPTTVEIADESNMPVHEIERLRKEVTKDLVTQEHLITKGMGFAQSDKAMQVARDVLYSLEPKHQLVLEYTLGLNGRSSLVKKTGGADVSAIAKAAGISIADVRNARKVIKRKFQDYRSFMGKGDNVEHLFDEGEG